MVKEPKKKETEEERLFRLFRNVSQNKNLTDEEINKKVQLKLKEAKTPKEDVKGDFDYLGIEELYTKKEEKLLAKSILKKYLSQYQLESVADKMLVKQLVYLEIIQIRLQKELNSSYDGSDSVSSKSLSSIHNNLDQIVSVTEKLGITKDKQDESKTDGFKALELLQKKAKIWFDNNQASRVKKCPHCSQLVQWRMLPEKWEVYKFPYFKDRMLCNEKGLELLGKGVITPKEYGEIINATEDYTYWLVKRLSNEVKDKYNLWNVIKEDDSEVLPE